jgi:hypothetical protein
MEYTTVFDVSQRGTDWFPIVIGIVFVLFGLANIKNKHSIKGINPAAIIAIIFGILLSITILVFQNSNIYSYRQILAQNRAKVTEGVIENFHPMPRQGHDTERFTVNGILFEYSDYFSTPAFNNTSSHGGPLKSGLYVRIYYTESREFAGDNAILRIEIKQ